MTSAFIIEVNSQLQPDPNEETAALLRVLIHKVDNTTFGDNVPSIPQWTGPPHTIVRVQAILFASLATSLLSAFLAMLGKQWVNRYASVDMRGSAIERSQNRQRKLDGVDSWYFNQVMESLPLMLQAALLLLGFALSLYFWEVNTTVASVVLAFTSFGVLFFLFIVVAGTRSVSCPYQTPGAQILRRVPGSLRQILDALGRIPRTALRRIGDVLRHVPHILRHIPAIPLHIPDVLRYVRDTIHRISHALHQGFSASVKGSICCDILAFAWDGLESPSLADTPIALFFVLLLPIFLTVDACTATTYLLLVFSRRLERDTQQQTVLLDLHCISWTLQTSLDGPVRLPTLKYLATIPLADFDPTLVVDCFNILIGCVKTIDGRLVITQGMGELAAASSLCCLRTLSHLLVTNPYSRSLGDACTRYARAFQSLSDLDGLPFSYILRVIRRISRQHITHAQFRRETLPYLQWEGYGPPNSEHASVAHALAEAARFEYEWSYRVPCWILRFAFHFLSQSPLPPATVVVDCLSIIAINLGCDTSSVRASEERCVRILPISTFLTNGQHATTTG